jgi:hypothetical protein
VPVGIAEGDVAVAEDVPQAAENPITAHISAAAMIHRLFPFDSNRRTPGRRRWLALVTEADESDEDPDGAPSPAELPATGGPDVALETGRVGTVTRGLVGS